METTDESELLEIRKEEKRLLMLEDETQQNIRDIDYTVYVSMIAIDNYIHQKMINMLSAFNSPEQLTDLASTVVRNVADALITRSDKISQKYAYDDKINFVINNLYGHNVSNAVAVDIIHATEMAVSQAIVEACSEFDSDTFDTVKTYSYLDNKTIEINLYFKP